ncbi:MAG TPA: adenylosuccinate synthase [Candidatus Peribacteria bacterium]|nr:adenylosuccinate synthase [Candidatus Peribacteria bacterium]
MDKLLKDLGPVCAIIGAQWGDEGKGKVIDILAGHYDVIARACGGANAGHTIVVGGKKHVFHLLPAGCLHDGKPVVLGAGMVIHLPTLLEEIDTLKQAGIHIVERLHLSGSAHIVFDFHKQVDGAMEERRGDNKIGTTKRGIGPAYMEKAARSGVRLNALRRLDERGLKDMLESKAKELKAMYGVDVDVKTECDQMHAAAALLHNRIVDAPQFLSAMLTSKRSILIEGAQATLLDIDHGTYPFVTSSATTVAGALQGLGLPPSALTGSVGVAKAYCTRVGSGDFLTEAEPAVGDRLRERGGEYGATTGRPRRCGWLDISDLRYAAMLNGFTCWNITKLDVLDEEDSIPVAIGRNSDEQPAYESLPGWKTSTFRAQSYKALPEAAKRYVEFIETQTAIPVRLVGTGPGREDMIVR